MKGVAAAGAMEPQELGEGRGGDLIGGWIAPGGGGAEQRDPEAKRVGISISGRLLDLPARDLLQH